MKRHFKYTLLIISLLVNTYLMYSQATLTFTTYYITGKDCEYVNVIPYIQGQTFQFPTRSACDQFKQEIERNIAQINAEIRASGYNCRAVIQCSCSGNDLISPNGSSNKTNPTTGNLNFNGTNQGEPFFSPNPSLDTPNWVDEAGLQQQLLNPNDYSGSMPTPKTGNTAFDNAFQKAYAGKYARNDIWGKPSNEKQDPYVMPYRPSETVLPEINMDSKPSNNIPPNDADRKGYAATNDEIEKSPIGDFFKSIGDKIGDEAGVLGRAIANDYDNSGLSKIVDLAGDIYDGIGDALSTASDVAGAVKMGVNIADGDYKTAGMEGSGLASSVISNAAGTSGSSDVVGEVQGKFVDNFAPNMNFVNAVEKNPNKAMGEYYRNANKQAQEANKGAVRAAGKEIKNKIKGGK